MFLTFCWRFCCQKLIYFAQNDPILFFTIVIISLQVWNYYKQFLTIMLSYSGKQMLLNLFLFSSYCPLGIVWTQTLNLGAMFVERKVCYSALITNLVRWHESAVSFPLSDIILAQLACPLSNVILFWETNVTQYFFYFLPLVLLA